MPHPATDRLAGIGRCVTCTKEGTPNCTRPTVARQNMGGCSEWSRNIMHKWQAVEPVKDTTKGAK